MEVSMNIASEVCEQLTCKMNLIGADVPWYFWPSIGSYGAHRKKIPHQPRVSG